MKLIRKALYIVKFIKRKGLCVNKKAENIIYFIICQYLNEIEENMLEI